MLTAYNGETITYDAIGNPLTYRSGMTFGWDGGRKLTSFSTPNAVGNYVYNADGIRVYKEVNGNKTEYYLNGTQIETEITNFGGVTRRVDYIYDENGSIYGFVVDNTNKYYYTKNLQGDIIGILDSAGTQIVEYSYDAWGKSAVSYPNADSLTKAQKQANYFLGSNNPFRYRGYYFDNETGFYYLNSRYYDPEVGRFINADSQLNLDQDILGANLFTYCLNNPVNMADSDGYAAANIIGGILGGATGAALGYLLANLLGLTGWKKWALISAATVGGAVLGAFLGPYVAKLAKSIGSAVKTTAKTVAKQAPKSLCFVAGTLVKSQDGQIPIETVKIGDYVYAENPETGEKDLKQVVQTFVNQTDKLVHVKINGEQITTTPGHPFYVKNKGWIGADELNSGDILVTYNDEQVSVENIAIEFLSTPVKVYNFEVEDFHTYFVGEGSFLVHNKGCGLNKLTSSYLKKTLKLDAHAIKKEYLGNRAKIALYDLAVDKSTGIIYIVDKAGKVITETIYRTK